MNVFLSVEPFEKHNTIRTKQQVKQLDTGFISIRQAYIELLPN